MKLAFSNIAWDIADDDRVLKYMAQRGFSGLEIAPTKIFGSSPYTCTADAKDYAKKVYEEYGLIICSMQSIWYGQTGNIFVPEQRSALKEYTYRAIEFAAATGCPNLVFGNPKARNRIAEDQDSNVAEFFKDIAAFAKECGTCISLEPNPVIYGTNFINTTNDAFAYCKALNAPLKVNADLGAVIYNNENIDLIGENISLVNHLHISEPHLAKPVRRPMHKELTHLDCNGFVSVEMGSTGNIDDVFETIDYISEVLQ